MKKVKGDDRLSTDEGKHGVHIVSDLHSDKKNLHFESLRGILALTVLVSHVSLVRIYFGRSTEFLNPIIFHLGRVAVTGFFVLSGYLITVSILKRIQNNNWNIRNFYLGRMFRIWPVYFFIIILAIWVLPHVDLFHFIVPNYISDVRTSAHDYLYFVFFAPQVPFMHNAVLPFAEPTWSIGVEEIFYLIIPFALIFSKNKFRIGLVIFILLFISAKYISIYYLDLPSSNYFAKILKYYSYDCIGLGCLMGILHFTKSKLFSSIKFAHAIVSVILIFILFYFLTLKSYDYFPFAICFAVLIAFLSNAHDKFKSPKWLVYIGTISYSLYLTHEIIIVFLVNLDVDKKSMLLMYFLSIILAIIFASIIYFTIERPIMNYGNSKLKTLTKK